MKYLKNITTLVATTLLACCFIACGGDNDRNEMRWTGNNDTVEVSIIVGSAEGGKLLPPMEDKKLRAKYVQRHFADQYKIDFYSKLSVEFNDNLLTYIDSAKRTQIIAPYQFNGDSLFVSKSNRTNIYIALGNKAKLHRNWGGWRTIVTKPNETSPTVTVGKANRAIVADDILKAAGFDNLSEIRNPKDTLTWLNVKYNFD